MTATGRKPRAFLNRSPLFSGIGSEEGGARMLLRLGEVGANSLVASSQVLAELNDALARKAPASLPLVALLLDRAQVELVPSPNKAHLRLAARWTSHPGDAAVLAAARQASPDFFVTLDRRHFLENKRLTAGVPFPLGTPGDALSWIRRRFVDDAQGGQVPAG